MAELTEAAISCPYCGEIIIVLVDGSLPEQQYVEDCEVCCRPIVISVIVDQQGDVVIGGRAEND